MPGGGLGAKHAVAPFHAVEVDLQNALLAQHQLQQWASTSSWPLRSKLRSPDSSRFLASCWVMVEPP
jgi:hypothetical protein